MLLEAKKKNANISSSGQLRFMIQTLHTESIKFLCTKENALSFCEEKEESLHLQGNKTDWSTSSAYHSTFVRFVHKQLWKSCRKNYFNDQNKTFFAAEPCHA